MGLHHLRWIVAGAALIVAIATTDARAVPMTYNNLSAFQTAAGSASITLIIDEFDGVAPFMASQSTIDRGPYLVTDDDPPGSMNTNTNSAFCEGGAAGGEGCLIVTTGVAEGFTFTFDTPINAFGFSLIKAPASIIPLLTLNDNNITGSYTAQGSLQIGFFGLIDSGVSFTSVELSGITGGNLIGLDTIRYGAVNETSPVPEPSSLALILGGLPGLWAAARYARSRKQG